MFECRCGHKTRRIVQFLSCHLAAQAGNDRADRERREAAAGDQALTCRYQARIIGRVRAGLFAAVQAGRRDSGTAPTDQVRFGSGSQAGARYCRLTGDRYAGEFPRELFRKHHIDYDASAKPKSDLFRDALPLLNSKKASLLDHTKLINQFVGLERRTARSMRRGLIAYGIT
jgi:hypothetical protein